jgi:hypothetical protein
MIRSLRLLRSGLSALLVLCLALRVMAWLVAPALPLLVVLFGLTCLGYLVLFGRAR